ncbi:MAG: hypothetical protein GY942_20130, partial [Aestuariibacter sp.]|nr:hypothetical protein [Aestuariibacter sp.]
LVDVSALTTGFEKGVTSLSMKFAKATGMTHMNEGTKLFTGVLYQDQAIAAIVRGDWKHRSLKDYGISESVGKRIQNQMGHVEHYEGSVYLPNSIAWDDRGAASAFDAATKKAVDETIITPGIIDRPKWIDHEMGKIVGQFRSFTFASNNRAVLSGLSGHSAHFYGGMAELTFLGLLAYASKGVVSGRSEEVMNTLSGGDVEKLIGEATANSGLGIVPELAQSMAKVLGLGMTSDKYQVRNMTSVIVGANLGAIEDILRVINAASDGEFKESEKRAMVRSIPYNNLAYTDGISRAIYKD